MKATPAAVADHHSDKEARGESGATDQIKDKPVEPQIIQKEETPVQVVEEHVVSVKSNEQAREPSVGESEDGQMAFD